MRLQQDMQSVLTRLSTLEALSVYSVIVLYIVCYCIVYCMLYILYRAEVNEQIAVALVRLQQDMQSVLTRLSTLEALSVAQTRVRSRTPSENERDRQVQHTQM